MSSVEHAAATHVVLFFLQTILRENKQSLIRYLLKLVINAWYGAFTLSNFGESCRFVTYFRKQLTVVCCTPFH